MAAGDATISYLGTFNLSGTVGANLSGSVIANVTYSQVVSGASLQIVPMANGQQVSVFKVVMA